LKTILTFTIIFIINFAIFANPSANFEKQIQNHRNKADSLQNLISQSEKKISELAKKETEQLSKLNEMEKAIEASKELIVAVEKQIDSVRLQKEMTEFRLDKTQELLENRKKIMISRLQSVYKMGEPSLLSIILGANSPEEVAHRIRYMQDLNKYDRNLLDTIRQDEQKLQVETQTLQTETQILAELLKEQQIESEKVKEQASARKKFLDELRSEKDRWEISMREYQNAQTELNKIIEILIAEMSKPTAADKKSDFAQRKGKLPWAVNGKVIANFGKIIHPEYKTTIVNNGISIEAPNGTPVKSVAAGVVEFVGRMRGYGKFMIINHFDDYLTIYAHLDENFFEKGASVREGQIIASVGESGSLDGSKLHFEIRHGNTALNPFDWLKKR